MRLIITTIHDEAIPDIADSVIGMMIQGTKLIIRFADTTSMSYEVKEILSIDFSSESPLVKTFPSNMIVH